MGHNRKEIEYIIDKSGCHLCISHYINRYGYPMLNRDGSNQEMHRFLYKLIHGEIPVGMFVRHKCDNPKCINQGHLELGTHAENMKDMVSRNRSLKGEKNPRSKLSEDDVRAIKSDVSTTNTSLGKKYGVHHDTISKIRLGKIWAHIN